MERSNTEIALFATGAFAVWLFACGVVITVEWIAVVAVLLLLFCVGCLALRNSE